MSYDIHTFEDSSALVAALSQTIAEDLRIAIEQYGSATMAVSGGNTPKKLFDALSQQPLNWAKVTVTLVDERWLPATHADANAGLVATHLLQHKATNAQFTSLYTNHSNPFAAEEVVNAKLATLKLPLDVVVLGMGDDGHTASFFPSAETLANAINPDTTNLCCAVQPPFAPYQRMTLTLPVIVKSQHCYLHIEGAQKMTILQRALAGDDAMELPVRAVLHNPLLITHIYQTENPI